MQAQLEQAYGADSASAGNANYVVEVAIARAATGLAQDGQTEKALELAGMLQQRGWVVNEIEELVQAESFPTWAIYVLGGIGSAVLLALVWLLTKPRKG